MDQRTAQSGTSYVLLINGVPGKVINCKIGVRQGYPPSPLLFVFVADLFTTRNIFFAKCLKQSAKRGKHSAKALPSVTLGKEGSTNSTSATASLSSTFYRALGKDFAECQPVLDKKVTITVTRNCDGACASGHSVALGKGSLFAQCPLY
jgi:hypothetical protein